MHKYIILFFSVALFLAACGSETNTPATIIEKPQMISLLTDLHVADGELYAVPQQADSLYKFAANRYKALFARHHTTDAQFKRSLEYYTRQPELIQEMYDTLGVIMKRKIDSLTKADAKKLKNAVPQQ